MNITTTFSIMQDYALLYTRENFITISIMFNIFLFGNILYRLCMKPKFSSIYYDILHLNNYDIEKIMVMLSSRAIIPNIYTKERVSDMTQLDITNEEWTFILNNQYELTNEYNNILIDWIKYITHVSESDSDYSEDELETNSDNKEENVCHNIITKLENLPYTVLQNLAEINNKSKKKKELVQIIIKKIQQSN